ncbi:hypothetical protein [Methyloferula stellata]|uniref:hypothetical protein n=1 Tax=Methyloferula stellata TaxID=876270 RepID=UPI00037AE396|nr:hypothetical protein [Methyloferula stellata]
MSTSAMSTSTIERVGPHDRFADYCLWDYEPRGPAAGKLRSSTLLWTFLEMTGADPFVRDCCEAMRRTLGPFKTVWGIKERFGHFSYEFYFYDYERLERTTSIERVLGGLSPFVSSNLTVSPQRPYFMFSLDIDDRTIATRRIDELSLYIGNPTNSVSSGICYNVTAEAIRLDNLYYFFDREREIADIRAKIACSAHLDLRNFDLDAILWPDMMDCGIVVVANKKFNDGVYFARLPFDGFERFVRKVGFPPDYAGFISEHSGELDHMLYDVGIDYISTESGIKIVKSAIYGLL